MSPEQIARAGEVEVAYETFGDPADPAMLLVMGLGATKDTEITVRAEGDDAAEAVDTLSGMLAAVTPIDATASG